MRTHRRSFVRGLGAAAVALPFMRLLERGAKAQAMFPKRIVFFATPNGTVMDSYWPSSCAFGPILEPLAMYKDKMVVMRGLDMKSAYKTPVPKDHLPDFSNLLTGIQPAGQDYGQMSMSGLSLDQAIANAIGDQTRERVLNLGVATYESSYPLLAKGPGAMFLPESSPYKAYGRLFQDVTSMPSDIDRLRAERRSVLDLVGQEVTALRCALGSDDRPRLDQHLETVRELERGLAFTAGAECNAPMLGAELDVKANANFPVVGQKQMDVIVAALACDLTRVATLQWSNGASQTHHTWVGVDFTHHGVSHGSEGVTADENTRRGWLVKIETWYATQFKYLLDKLSAIPEGDGTMLDNTVCVWIHEQSNGGSHQRTDMPFVLAGSCGGFFGTGRCLDLKGRPHNDLLVSLAHAMDVQLDKFGDQNFTGPIEELRS